MRSCCRSILEFTAGLSYEQFIKDNKTRDAVLRNLEIIGEATKQLPEAVRQSLPHIEWRKIMRMRDIVAHAYFGIDDKIVWDVIQNKIPELLREIDSL